MKLGIKTDFRDFYDHLLDSPPFTHVLFRQSKGGLSKRKQFNLLETIGFATPVNGLVKEIWDKTPNKHLVVYLDKFAHCGEGKILCHKTFAVKEFPDKYASIFIPSTNDELFYASSRRLLAIGDRMFWLRYESKGSWMSNHADEVEIKVEGETLRRYKYAIEGELDFSLLKAYPLFAIDFVESLTRKQLMAIDFNSAPGMRHTGIEDFISASSIVKELKNFIALNQQ